MGGIWILPIVALAVAAVLAQPASALPRGHDGGPYAFPVRELHDHFVRGLHDMGRREDPRRTDQDTGAQAPDTHRGDLGRLKRVLRLRCVYDDDDVPHPIEDLGDGLALEGCDDEDA